MKFSTMTTHHAHLVKSLADSNSTHAVDDATLSLDFDPLASMSDNLARFWQSISDKLKHSYALVADSLFDEVLIKASEQQLNDALDQFVVQNVDMVHDLRLSLHEDWLRLYATIYIQGIFAKVACDFRLVGIELTGDVQRVIFEQLSDTHVLTLHSKTWWQAPAAKSALWLYHLLLRHDPLPVILQKITVKEEPFAVHKGRFIYLDIGRYFAKSPHIIAYFKKAQVNTAHTTHGNLIAHVQLNLDEVIGLGRDDDIISEKDNPHKQTSAQTQ